MASPYTDVTFSNSKLTPNLANKLNMLRDDLSAAIGLGGGTAGPPGPTGPTGPPGPASTVPGPPGVAGAQGVNAFTTLTADLPLPGIGNTVSPVTVVEAIWIIVGQFLWFDGGGGNAHVMQVLAKSGNTLTLLQIS